MEMYALDYRYIIEKMSNKNKEFFIKKNDKWFVHIFIYNVYLYIMIYYTLKYGLKYYVILIFKD